MIVISQNEYNDIHSAFNLLSMLGYIDVKRLKGTVQTDDAESFFIRNLSILERLELTFHCPAELGMRGYKKEQTLLLDVLAREDSA